MTYQVIAAVDSLDPNPEFHEFDTFEEASDFIYEEINRRVSFQVEHSPYPVTDQDLKEIEETELELFRLQRVNT